MITSEKIELRKRLRIRAVMGVVSLRIETQYIVSFTD
jgi:hypothetical protein